jgi:hypothetical protein
MADEDEPQLHVTRPFSPGELAELGKVHPEEAIMRAASSDGIQGRDPPGPGS